VCELDACDRSAVGRKSKQAIAFGAWGGGTQHGDQNAANWRSCTLANGVARHRWKLLVKNLLVPWRHFSMLCLTTCSDSLKRDVQFLASNVYFIVGGQDITIPVVAIRGARPTTRLIWAVVPSRKKA